MPIVARASRRLSPILAAFTTSLLLGACAGGSGPQLADSSAPLAAKSTEAALPKSELQKATDYWGKRAAENPKDPRAAVNYARNLKASGNKRDAMTALQVAHQASPDDRELNSEFGRLALEHDQVVLAQRLLEQADDPANPDWRVLSARGTALAKQGKHADAISFYERARELAPDQPSVLNNLAMAHAMAGKSDKAEDLLRQAARKPEADARVQQNLALVLGLNGKHDEARVMGADQMSPETSAQNAEAVRQMVQSTEPVPAVVAPPALAAAPVMPTAGARAANGKGSKISTASVASDPAPAKGKAKGKAGVAAEPEVDAAELVRRLADGDTGAAPKR